MSSSRSSRFHTRRDAAETGALRQVLFSPVQRWQKEWVAAGEGKVDSRGKPIQVLRWIKTDLKPETFEDIEDEAVVETPRPLGASSTEDLLSPQGTPGGSSSATGTPSGKPTDSPGMGSTTSGGPPGGGREPMDSPSHAPVALNESFQKEGEDKERKLPNLDPKLLEQDEMNTTTTSSSSQNVPTGQEKGTLAPSAETSSSQSESQGFEEGEGEKELEGTLGDDDVIKIDESETLVKTEGLMVAHDVPENSGDMDHHQPSSEGLTEVKAEDRMDTTTSPSSSSS